MKTSTVTSGVAESEAVLMLRVSARRKMSQHQYLRWLVNRFLLEVAGGRMPLPAPQVSPRDWPVSVGLDRHTFAELMQFTSTPRPKRITLRAKLPDPSQPSAAALMRALIHDDARRLGIMFDKDWKWDPVYTTASSALT